ncbi:MAG: hypothetical protein H6Q61_771 [Firmicutes bacterium]|nr:hypothetical protein [Bacillota bacterium]
MRTERKLTRYQAFPSFSCPLWAQELAGYRVWRYRSSSWERRSSRVACPSQNDSHKKSSNAVQFCDMLPLPPNTACRNCPSSVFLIVAQRKKKVNRNRKRKRNFHALPDLSVASHHILIAGQLPQTHGTSGVELLCGNAHFTAKSELPAVGKPGGGVQIDGGTVH